MSPRSNHRFDGPAKQRRCVFGPRDKGDAHQASVTYEVPRIPALLCEVTATLGDCGDVLFTTFGEMRQGFGNAEKHYAEP